MPLHLLRVSYPCGSLEQFAERHLSDVSAAGMFVRSAQPLPVGTQLRFELTLEGGAPLLEGQAVVVWVTEETGNPELPAGMELRFELLPPESQHRFEWLQLLKRGAALLPSGTGPLALDDLPEGPREASPPAVVEPGPPRSLRPPGGVNPLRPASGVKPLRPADDLEVLSVEESAPSAAFDRTPTGGAGVPPPVPSDSDDHLFHATASSRPELAAAKGVKHPARGRRRSWIIAPVGLALLLGLGGLAGYRALRGASPAPARVRRVLRLSSEPSGAEVVLDGRRAGRTPLEVTVQPRSRVLLQLEGREPESIALEGFRGWLRVGDADLLNLLVRLAEPAATTPAAVCVAATPPETAVCRPLPRLRGRRLARPAATQPARAASAADAGVAPAEAGPATRPAQSLDRGGASPE